MQPEQDVPLWRLWVLRAAYGIFVFPALAMAPFGGGPLARAVIHAPDDRGMINGIQIGLVAMCALGLRYPLKMLPVLLFEGFWKTVWLFAYGLPQGLSGVRAPQWELDIYLIGGAPLVFGLIIPWSYVWRHYFQAPAERWR